MTKFHDFRGSGTYSISNANDNIPNVLMEGRSDLGGLMSSQSVSAKVGVHSFLSVIIQCSLLTVGLLHRTFRPKDVLFFLDLIKNLVHHEMLGRSIDIQFVQLQRWLKRYEDLGWIESSKDGKAVVYSLKAAGVRELLRALILEDQWIEVSETLLLQQMLDSYSGLLRENVRIRFPELTRKELAIEALLSPGAIIKGQIRILDRMITDQNFRITESQRLQNHCKDSLQKGLKPEEIAKKMPSEFSYTLTHQRSFKELLSEIPAPLAEYEIREGFQKRHRDFYQPYLRFLEMQRNFYQELLKKSP